MTELEKEVIKKANLEDLIELRMDIIPVSYYNKCATHKDGIIKELKQRLEKLEKEYCSYITEILPGGQFVFKPNQDFLANPYRDLEKEEINNAIKTIKKYCKNDSSGKNGGYENCEHCILSEQCIKSFNEWEEIK